MSGPGGSAASFVSVRQFGEVEVAVISSGQIHFHAQFEQGADWQTDDTDLDDAGRLVMGINGVLLRTPEATILVDPNSWVPPHDIASAELIPAPPIEAVCDTLALDPLAVTHVPISHGHADHFTALLHADGSLRFQNAEHLFPAADWTRYVEEGEGRGADEVRALLLPVERAGKLRLVSGDTVVAPGVSLHETGGESPGHQILRLDTPASRFYYLGDLVHTPVECRELDWVFVRSRDVQALARERRRLFAECGEKPSTLVYTHARFPAWGRVEPTGDTWRWRYDPPSAP